jgi:hypothetical protein
MFMQWMVELSEKERLLRKDFENLSSIRRGRDLVTYEARAVVVRRIRSRMREIQQTIDSKLSENDPHAHEAISYQLDLRLPTYSHLSKLPSLFS